MQHLPLFSLALVVPLLIALGIRRRLIETRPMLGAVIVVVAAGLGIAAAIALAVWRDAHRLERDADHAFDGMIDHMCSPASIPDARAFQAVACVAGSRMATVIAGRLEFVAITGGDRAMLAVMHLGEPASGSAPPPPATTPGVAYWLWALDRSGRAIGGWEVTQQRFVAAPRLSEATDIALSLETGQVAPSSPTQVIARARLVASPYARRERSVR